MDVVGLGALNLDIIYRVDFENLPQVKRGEEKKIDEEDISFIKRLLEKKGRLITKSGGGSAANTIYALSRMGFSCGFAGRVGEDKEGDFLLQDLMAAGVDTTGILREGKTGICFILVDKKGERSILVVPGTNDNLLPHQVDMDYINRAKILHTTSFIGNTSFQTQKKIVLRAKPLISFDPGQPHANKGWNELFPILQRTHILFSTEREVEIITYDSFKEGCRRMVRGGVKIVVCKMGEEGSWIITREKEIFIPSRKVKSVDTTGAGDVYAAGFLAGFLNKLSLIDCGKLGTYAAAISIAGFGREKYPGRKILQDFLQE